MRMPGFTAEDSLYQARDYRRLRAFDQPRTDKDILPQSFAMLVARAVCWIEFTWRDETGFMHGTYFCAGVPIYSW